VTGRFTDIVFVYRKLILVHSLRNQEEYYHVLYIKVKKTHSPEDMSFECLCFFIHF